MKLHTQVQTFLQDFLFLSAVRNDSGGGLIRFLTQQGMGPDRARFCGDTALHIAIKLGCTNSFDTLLDYHADVSLETAKGHTALQLAVESEQLYMVERLLKRGARYGASYGNGIPLDDLLNPLATEEPRRSIPQIILDLLKVPPLVDGPLPATVQEYDEKQQHGGAYQSRLQAALLPGDPAVCKSFHITIANFFTTKAKREVFDIRTATVHDVLYETTPADICTPVVVKARETEGLEATRFSWYHIPANNVRYPQRELKPCLS
jgi:hypothetical protein